MRALSLLPCRFWGGPEKQTLRLSTWLRDHAAVETVIAVMPTDADSVDDNPLLLALGRRASRSLRSFRSGATTCWKACACSGSSSRAIEPDVVCATGYKADVLAAWLADTPTVATLRGWTAQDAKVRLFEWLDRRTLRRHDSVIVVSNTLREAAIRAGAAPQRVFWVPNAIDPDQLPPPRLREDLCREIGADPRPASRGSRRTLEPRERPPRPDRGVRPVAEVVCREPASRSQATAPKRRRFVGRWRRSGCPATSPSWDCEPTDSRSSARWT
jgi:glycosyltransferase involved in cell wall biosynthesis